MKQLSELSCARSYVRALKIAALLNVIAAMTGAPAARAQSASNREKTLAPVKLRGYGLVSGQAQTHADGSSLLRIETESPEKAKLLQAKYLSDFGLQPGVKSVDLTIGAVRLGAEEAQGQGFAAALRSGKIVYIAAAPDSARLVALVKTLPADALAASKAVVDVPMYLDRWDKFNFRHYYRPWEKPPKTTDSTYDYVHEFDWAKEQSRAGFVFWNEVLPTDSGQGMMNYGWWDWASNEAANRHLPVGINFGGEPPWLFNEFREQTQMKMPTFVGNHHELASPFLGGEGVLSWNSTTLEDARLGILQESTRHFVTLPNVTTFLEPHGELKQGNQDIFMEYGPVADTAYRTFLQSKYGTPEKVAARWGRDLKSWDDVHVPELAMFEGWGPQALDVTGEWHIGYETLESPMPKAWRPDMRNQLKSTPAPEVWFQPDFDDSAWPKITAPGDYKELFLVKRPAVFRRNFEAPTSWKADHPKAYLYLWDLNMVTNGEVRVVLNGTQVSLTKIRFTTPHWSAMDVSDVLKPGKNSLAIRLPQGYMGYRAYVSPVAPRQYPNLGTELNSQWVDFTDFTQWSRVHAVKRGMEMIRQAAPDHQIVLMSPTAYGDGVKALAKTYGGELHDTGAMGAFWDELPATLSRGGDLPTSVEPGGPADDLAGWKEQWGRWQTEGVQAVDYFIHIGNVLWKPEIKADYEAHRKQIELMGQSHLPKAETAVLYSDRTAQLTGVPWGFDPNVSLGGGYWNWNAASVLRGTFPCDGITQSSFANGEADEYRVVVDSNTSMMDESMVSDIERWVRAGGTFITLAQTGRSTPETPDSWPISRLTGYTVARIDRIGVDGKPGETGTLSAAPAQNTYGADWAGATANGLHLEKVAPDAQNLLLWNDGTVAAGVRPLGKGYIVQLGAKFTDEKIFDRVEPGGNNAETRQLRRLLAPLLDWRQVAHEPAHFSEPNEWVWLRPGVTNNGLYDTWVMWNWSKDTSQTISLVLEKGRTPAFAVDARTGASVPTTPTAEGTELKGIVLEPLETRVFLTPRNQIGAAPLAWFELQRNWWRGTTTPEPKVLPRPAHPLSEDLTADWKFQSAPAGADVTDMTAPGYDDGKWPAQKLGVWDAVQQGHRGIMRKTFTVPVNWGNGRVSLWVTSSQQASFVGTGRVLLDGKEIKPDNREGLTGLQDPGLKAGTKHVLVIDAKNDGVLAGLRGEAWLAFEPTPAPGDAIDLNGQWQSSRDVLTFDSGVAVPGPIDAQMLQRSATVDDKYKGKTAVITVEGDAKFNGVIVNGTLIRRDRYSLGERWSLTVTPFIRYGEKNEFVLITADSVLAKKLTDVQLGFY